MRKAAAGLAAAVLLVAATLLVAGRAEAAEAVPTGPAAPAGPGAMGGTRITDVFIRTSVRERKAWLDIEVTGARNAGLVNLTARMLNEAGEEETVFVKTMRIEASPVQVVTVMLAWRNPRLWDLGQPNLYTLKLKAAGAGLDQEVTQEFGFRELAIDGRDFFLNGTKVHFRPLVLDWKDGIADAIDKAAGLGFTLGEVWPDDGDFAAIYDVVGGKADRKGFAVIGVIPDISKVDNQDDPAQRAAYQEKLAKFIRTSRNHPSILMWNTAPDGYRNGRDMDPRLIGQRGWAVDREVVGRNQKALEVMRIVKAYDPTRPVFAHEGNYVGDVYTAGGDLGMLPLQERADWLSAWADSGKMPVMMLDFLAPRWMILKSSGPSGIVATEWAAAEFGNEAYRLEDPLYRRAVAQPGDSKEDFSRRYVELRRYVAMIEMQRLFFKNMWQTWRTWGISGGMAPLDEKVAAGDKVRLDDMPEALDPLKPYNGPAVAWIAGSARDGFTSKDHSYRAGERVAKQIVLINDDRKGQPYTFAWSASVGASEVGKGSDKGTMKPGEILLLPIEFALPEKIAVEKDTGAIHLTATIGQAELADEFALRVFAPPPECKVTAAVFDPAGETTAMLKALGVTVQPMDEKATAAPAAGSLVIVGRRALSDMHTIPFDVDAFVKGGGRLLIMEQDRLWMRQGLGLRTAEPLMRQVFRIDPLHPVAAGLDDVDLGNWAGVSKLMPESIPFGGYDQGPAPAYGWHWGNRGAVTSAAVEKPHRTSWRPLLECGFDLAYTPLMEMDYGRGRVTLCTLDLEDHAGVDAAARRLAVNVLNYVATAPLAPKAEKVLYVGDAAGAALLDMMGVEYEDLHFKSGGTIDPASKLVILGRGATAELDAAMFGDAQRVVGKGGKVLVLPRKESARGTSGVVFANFEKRADFAGSLKRPAWLEARGLSPSDLRWRAPHEAWLLKDTLGLEIGADGLLGRLMFGTGEEGGRFIFCQIDPTALPADEKTYFRYTRWRETRALAQVLANLGATFKQDHRQIELFQQPDHPFYLEGTWEAKLTHGVTEILPPKAIEVVPMTRLAQQYVKPDAPASAFERVYVPAYMQSYGPGWEGMDGEAVFRRVLMLPESFAGRDLVLSLGRVGEAETTFFNGQKVGESGPAAPGDPKAGDAAGGPGPRSHVIPGKLVKAGRNVLTVRVFNAIGSGGLCGQPDEIFLAPKSEPTRFYHDDYRQGQTPEGVPLADDPYRYGRW
jgi:beta-galactosidase